MTRKLLPVALLLAAAGLAHAGKKAKPLKIFLIAGQSNAVGHGSNKHLEANEPELVKPRDEVWYYCAGRVPGPLGPGCGFRYDGFGPELKFGHVIGDAIDNEVLILKWAVGGTTIQRQWRPPSAVKRAGGEIGPLYGVFIRRVHHLLANLHDLYPRYRGQGYELAGFVWFQGENDTCAKEEDGTGFWEFYQDNLTDLIADVRRDLAAPELPVVIVQINDACWERGGAGPVLRAAQEYVAKTTPHVAMAVTKDLDSGYHYNAASYVTIGDRIGRAMLPLVKGKKSLLPFGRKERRTDEAAVRKAAKRFLARTVRGKEQDVSTLKKGLLGYWKFDEGRRNQVASTVPGGAEGRIHARRDVWVPGRFGSAVRLEKNERIEFRDFRDPVGPKGTIEALSVAFWCKTPCKEGPCHVGKGRGKAYPTTDGKNWYLSPYSNVAGWGVREFDVDGCVGFTAAFAGDGKEPAPAGIWEQPGLYGDGVEWHHVAIVYDAAKKSLVGYRDGRPFRREAKDLPAGGIVPADVPLTLGGLMLEHDDFNYQVYDELAIWSRPLTAAEVAALYNGGVGAELTITNELERKSVAELRQILKTDIDAMVRYEATAALEKKGEAARALLLETLRDKTPYVRYRAAEVLARNFAADILPDMLTALRDPDPDMRRMATAVLKFLGKRALPAVPALTQALKDDSFDVREGAADALGAIGPLAEDAVPRLIAVLRRDPEWWVGDSAYFALASIGTPAALEAVMDKLNTDKHPVIWHQFGRLRQAMLSSENAEILIPIFLRWVKDGDAKKVMNAAAALRELPVGAHAIPIVRERLKDKVFDKNARQNDRARRSLEDLLKRLERAHAEKKPQ